MQHAKLSPEITGMPEPLSVADALNLRSINFNLQATDREAVLHELVTLVIPPREKRLAEKLLSALKARENLCSTCVNDGVAIPHSRNALVGLVDRPTIAYGRHKAGLEFGALDGNPVHHFFLLCAPSVRQHLPLLARLARILNNPDVRARLNSVSNADELIALVRTAEQFILSTTMAYPAQRPRRLRRSPELRALVRESSFNVGDLIQPLFVRPGRNLRRPISSMTGQFQLSVDQLVNEATAAHRLGVPAVILFGIPDKKDARASGAYGHKNIVGEAIRALKRRLPELVVIADVCLCEYMSHGHCGIVQRKGSRFQVDNDATLPLLARAAVAYADAGADIVAPSDMMDGRVAAIRMALDKAGHADLPIMSYAAKFASAFYGPFREAAESAPQFGDRRSYQMDPGNAVEAMREIALDLEEGADIVMIKPGLPYLDLVQRAKERFNCPVAVYNVSGEYAMLKAAAAKGWLDEKAAVLETMTAFKRAGADLILTYWAKDIAEWSK